MSKRTVKVVAVGDGGCGKSSLLVRFCKDQFADAYEPTMFENYAAEIECRSDYKMKLALFDTAGHHAYDRLRPLAYPDCDVVLVCFDLSKPGGIRAVETKWIPELEEFCPHAPFILVGCKSDARHGEAVLVDDAAGQSKTLNEQEVAKVAESLGAYAYIECSALTCHQITDVFAVTAEASTTKRRKKVRRRTSQCKNKRPRTKRRRSNNSCVVM